MALFKNKSSKSTLDELEHAYISAQKPNQFSNLFIMLIGYLRPHNKENATQKLNLLYTRIQEYPAFKSAIQNVFCYILNAKDPQTVFTHLGINRGGTFMNEMAKQIRHKLIPPLQDKDSLGYLLNYAFYKKDDHKWVNQIPDKNWFLFFAIIHEGLIGQQKALKQNIIDSLTVLSYRITYLGLEDAMMSRKLDLEEGIKTPFLHLNKDINAFIYLVGSNNPIANELIANNADVCLAKIKTCEAFINNIKSHTEKYGTSLEQSYLLIRTQQQLDRIKLLIGFLNPLYNENSNLQDAVSLFKSSITSINNQYSVSHLYKTNSKMLAYQVAEHKSSSGEHYITTTRSEYTKFFYAAAAGGLIISFTAVVKGLIHKLSLAPFWQYFLYSSNYALAFIILFITGASLATKQPSMTASTLASSLDSRKGGVDLRQFPITFGKVWRSQFASFAGNLIVVFPLAYIFSFLYQWITGDMLLDTKASCMANLNDQNPTKSLAWFYACITGVFLFTSGIITGYIDNKVIYSNIGARLYEHRTLRMFFNRHKLKTIADYVNRNLGGIIGNIALGFMLGYAKFFGELFGIPFDIRHITISTAYFGFGLEGLENQVALYDIMWTTIGVIGIGFFNFLISFGLAFTVAMRSRNISLKKTPRLLKMTGKYLLKFPFDFIYPPKKDRTTSEVFPTRAEQK